jgi:hypothetical protein
MNIIDDLKSHQIWWYYNKIDFLDIMFVIPFLVFGFWTCLGFGIDYISYFSLSSTSWFTLETMVAKTYAFFHADFFPYSFSIL